MIIMNTVSKLLTIVTAVGLVTSCSELKDDEHYKDSGTVIANDDRIGGHRITRIIRIIHETNNFGLGEGGQCPPYSHRQNKKHSSF